MEEYWTTKQSDQGVEESERDRDSEREKGRERK